MIKNIENEKFHSAYFFKMEESKGEMPEFKQLRVLSKKYLT